MKVYQLFSFRNASMSCSRSLMHLFETVLFHKGGCYVFVIFLSQVHFVPDAGTVAQIVYTDDQVRPPQQVVYTADGASYASVDGPEHTLVYIHPVEAAQACEGLLFI